MSHNLNPMLILSLAATEDCLFPIYNAYAFYISSLIFSNFDIQLGVKWQFCKSTHVPFNFPSSIAFSAKTPYPYPNEMTFKYLFLELAKV